MFDDSPLKIEWLLSKSSNPLYKLTRNMRRGVNSLSCFGGWELGGDCIIFLTIPPNVSVEQVQDHVCIFSEPPAFFLNPPKMVMNSWIYSWWKIRNHDAIGYNRYIILTRSHWFLRKMHWVSYESTTNWGTIMIAELYLLENRSKDYGKSTLCFQCNFVRVLEPDWLYIKDHSTRPANFFFSSSFNLPNSPAGTSKGGGINSKLASNKVRGR